MSKVTYESLRDQLGALEHHMKKLQNVMSDFQGKTEGASNDVDKLHYELGNARHFEHGNQQATQVR